MGVLHMKIKYKNDGQLVISDDTTELSFLDLANFDYKLAGNPKHYWVLYQCHQLVDKRIEFVLGTTYYPSGSHAELYFGYFLNNINRRVLKFNEDGTVREDKILLFNPHNSRADPRSYTLVSQSVKLEDYLGVEEKYYTSYDKKETIRNHFLGDNIIEDYNYFNSRYCNLLNYYCDNHEMLNNMVGNFEDDLYLTILEREIRNIKKTNNNPIRNLDK